MHRRERPGALRLSGLDSGSGTSYITFTGRITVRRSRRCPGHPKVTGAACRCACRLARPQPGVAERAAAADGARGVLIGAAAIDHDDLGRALRA